MAETTSDAPVILVDAYSQIFRSFFAIAHLSRHDGFPTNALFAFGRLLLQLEKDYEPRAGAMFFDCGKPAFRLALAADYKSNRPPMPEELRKQMPVLRELIAAFGWSAHQCENYEADDLIGAAVHTLPERAFRIVSSDKDLAQLIGERVTMLIPARVGSGFEARGAPETAVRFAVNPEQMVDYLALLGDNSDAIAGVPGVGPKTAADILHECGSLERFFAAPELVAKDKLRDKLLAARDLIERNRKLIRLRGDWPEQLPPPPDALVKHAPDWTRVAELFREYELRSLLKDLPLAPELPSAPAADAQPAPEPELPEEPDLFNWRPAPASDAAEKPAAGRREEASDDLFAGWTKP